MRFESPYFLFLLLAIPLVWERLNNTDKESALLFSCPISLDTLISASRATLRAPLLSTIRSLGFTLLIVALARPQSGSTFTEIQSTGRDIVFALDVSGSMRAMDFFVDGERATRLEALQHVVKKFVDERRGDRMGLVVFGGDAFIQCPLTIDQSALKQFVDGLEIGMGGDGTAVGNALGVSLKLIKDLEADSRVIVLVTDGKNNSGAITPTEGAVIAKNAGIKVHTIGIGGDGSAPFPTKSIFGTTQLVRQPMEFDEQTLIEIAQYTGGEYFNAKDTEALAKVYEQINSLETRDEEVLQHVQYEENFFGFLLAGILSLLLATLLSSTVLAQIPDTGW